MKKFNLKKNWMKLLITLLAVTTTFGLGSDLVSHQIQMYIFAGFVLFNIWTK